MRASTLKLSTVRGLVRVLERSGLEEVYALNFFLFNNEHSSHLTLQFGSPWEDRDYRICFVGGVHSAHKFDQRGFLLRTKFVDDVFGP